MRLSLRLETLLSLITPGHTLCDVGCDHGFLSIEAVRRGISPRILATDLREGPLRTAEAHIREAGLSEKIQTRLSDGVAAVRPGEAETFLLAGMGGRVILQILTEGDPLLRGAKEIILQPQSEVWRVRQYLEERSFRYTAEEMIEEDGKFYPILRGNLSEEERKGDEGGSVFLKDGIETVRALPPEALYLYGPLLLREANPCLHRYINKEQREQEKILTSLPEGAKDRRDAVTKRLALIKRILTEVYHEGL